MIKLIFEKNQFYHQKFKFILNFSILQLLLTKSNARSAKMLPHKCFKFCTFFQKCTKVSIPPPPLCIVGCYMLAAFFLSVWFSILFVNFNRWIIWKSINFEFQKYLLICNLQNIWKYAIYKISENIQSTKYLKYAIYKISENMQSAKYLKICNLQNI